VLRATGGEVEGRLEVQPELGAGLEGLPEQPGRLRRHPALAAHQFVDPLGRDLGMGSQGNLGHAHRLQELGQKDLARVGWDAMGRDHGFTCLVVVGKTNIECFGALPAEDNAPLVVDPDAVEPDQIPLQSFEMIVRRDL